MKSRYDETQARGFIERYAGRADEALALRVYTSRLLGQDGSLVLHGGGNTSLKGRAREITGEEVEVLYVKGSGRDLATIEPEGFPACRLDGLRRVARVETLGDEDLVKALRGQLLDPSGPTPSIEALLHALVGARYVDHTHADSVLSVVDQPDSAERAREVWGDGLLFVPYVKPGFVLSRRIAALGGELSRARALVLDKHGIFTWGESAQESYERMIEAVDAAERYLARGGVAVAPVPGDSARRAQQDALAPVVRGALCRAGDQRFILEWRDEAEILSLLARDDAKQVTAVGPATPDHVIRTKPLPLWLGGVPDGEAARAHVEKALSGYAELYDRYFERGRRERKREPAQLDKLPRVIHVPGLGALCAGRTLADARIAGDITLHTARVIADARSVGSYRPVGDLDLFDVEYWSMEQAKLEHAAGGALERKIALVTGAAGGIGLDTAALLAELGAHVVVADRDEQALDAAHGALAERFDMRVARAVADVTDQSQVRAAVAEAVTRFGGLDLVVSNAGTAPGGLLHEAAGDAALRRSLEINLLGHQNVARAASEVLLAQGIGGCLLFNASKSAFNQGPEFGPYAIPKAAVVALMKQYAVDLGKHGIRTGAVNADRIRTGLFGGGVLEARAKARGVSPDAYFQQNLLRRETTGRDVAEAFAYLAQAEATTGCVITVDGGNPAAFPR